MAVKVLLMQQISVASESSCSLKSSKEPFINRDTGNQKPKMELISGLGSMRSLYYKKPGDILAE